MWGVLSIQGKAGQIFFETMICVTDLFVRFVQRLQSDGLQRKDFEFRFLQLTFARVEKTLESLEGFWDVSPASFEAFDI